ncbi:MAG: efflux transporter outer membrane subunit [Verrucomicrobiota bacterium]
MKNSLPQLALISITMACVLLTSCAGPPKRVTPEWTTALPGNWSSPVVVLEQAHSGWLTTFNDPQLEALVAEAILNNPDIKASAARIDQALAEARKAGVALMPQIDASANGSRNQTINRAGSFGGGGFDDFDNFFVTRNNSLGISLDLTWELDVWGRVKKGQSAAIADSQAATYEFQSARLSLASQVAKAWFSAQEQYLQHQLALETFESFTRTAEITQSRFERGLQSATDVHLSKSSAASARASLDNTKLTYHQAVRSLEILLGRYPSQELEISTDLNAVPPPVPAGVPSDLILRRPDLLAAERRLAASDKRVSQARAAFLPRFALTASGGTSSDALRDLVDPKHFVWNFLVNLTQPLIDGGSRRADLDRNKAAVLEAAENYRGTALTAFKEVEDALDAEGLLESREAALLDAAEQGRMAYERAESEYRQGLTGIITVLDAQRRYLDSRRSYLTVKRIRLDNRINLHLALGGDFKPTQNTIENSDPIAQTEPTL